MPKKGKPRQMFTATTEAIAMPGSDNQPTPGAARGEHADQQVVQHAEAAVEDPQKVQRRDDGGRHPRDQQHACPERSASGYWTSAPAPSPRRARA